MSKFADRNEKIAEKVVGFYKKIEDGAVASFNKISDGFVNKFIAKEGETVEEAKVRMELERAAIQQHTKVKIADLPKVEVPSQEELIEKSAQRSKELVEKSMQQAKEAGAAARKAAGLE